MLEWVKKCLESVLGKTITGLIGVFILGAVSMIALPRWLVTTEIFQNEVKRVYRDMSKGDKWRKFDIVQLQKDIWEQWLEELEDQLETQGISPRRKQLNRLEEIKTELEYLRNYEQSLKTELEQYDKIHDILFTFKQP